MRSEVLANQSSHGVLSIMMTSLELVDVINRSRIAFGESEVRRNDFHARVRDELEGEHYEIFVVTNNNGTESEAYGLTLKQCMYVAMRESKGVRRQVQAQLENQAGQRRAPTLPNFADPVAAARAWADAKEGEQKAVAELALAAPKVNFFDKVVERTTLMTATQIAQKLGMSAIKLNKYLDELGIYAMGVKRARVFKQWVIDKGYGELKQTELGYSQPLFTTAGEAWIVERLTSEGVA